MRNNKWLIRKRGMIMKKYVSPDIEFEAVLPDVLLVSDLEIDMSGQYEDEGE